MTKKKIILSVTQLEHLISISVRNSESVSGREEGSGYKFLIIPDCMESADCIPHDQVPETDDEIMEILSTHGVLELSEFLENIGSMKEGNDSFRAFETVIINNKNLGDFLSILDELSNCWDETANEEESAPDLTGKNVIVGNGTLN